MDNEEMTGSAKDARDRVGREGEREKERKRERERRESDWW